jgi:hypothetical protein
MPRITDQTTKDIADKRQRASAPDMAASWRMSSLLQTFHSPAKHREEVLRYFPIAVVASIDGYFRTRMANLIDAGDPFRSNAVSNYPDVKLDMQMASALTTKKISLGELITYRVSIGSFSALIDFVKKVTGESGFPQDLLKVKPDLIGRKTKKTILTNPNATWKQLDQVFETRHILCHELAQDLVIDEEDTRLLLIAAQDFMKASATWVESLMAKHFPIRPGDRARETRRKISEAREHINNLIKSAKESAATHHELSGAAEAIATLEQRNAEYLSAIRDTWNKILGPHAEPVAEHHSEIEELNVLKVFLSTIASMLMEIDFHVARHRSDDFDPISFLEYILGGPNSI